MAKLPLTKQDFTKILREELNDRFNHYEKRAINREKQQHTEMMVGFGEIVATINDHMDDRFVEHGKRFDGIDQKFETIDKRFDGIDQKFEIIDKRFDGIDKKFDGIDKKFESMDKRFDKIELKLDVLKDIPALKTTVDDLNKRVAVLEQPVH